MTNPSITQLEIQPFEHVKSLKEIFYTSSLKKDETEKFIHIINSTLHALNIDLNNKKVEIFSNFKKELYQLLTQLTFEQITSLPLSNEFSTIKALAKTSKIFYLTSTSFEERKQCITNNLKNLSKELFREFIKPLQNKSALAYEIAQLFMEHLQLEKAFLTADYIQDPVKKSLILKKITESPTLVNNELRITVLNHIPEHDIKLFTAENILLEFIKGEKLYHASKMLLLFTLKESLTLIKTSLSFFKIFEWGIKEEIFLLNLKSALICKEIISNIKNGDFNYIDLFSSLFEEIYPYFSQMPNDTHNAKNFFFNTFLSILTHEYSFNCLETHSHFLTKILMKDSSLNKEIEDYFFRKTGKTLINVYNNLFLTLTKQNKFSEAKAILEFISKEDLLYEKLLNYLNQCQANTDEFDCFKYIMNVLVSIHSKISTKDIYPNFNDWINTIILPDAYSRCSFVQKLMTKTLVEVRKLTKIFTSLKNKLFQYEILFLHILEMIESKEFINFENKTFNADHCLPDLIAWSNQLNILSSQLLETDNRFHCLYYHSQFLNILINSVNFLNIWNLLRNCSISQLSYHLNLFPSENHWEKSITNELKGTLLIFEDYYSLLDQIFYGKNLKKLNLMEKREVLNLKKNFTQIYLKLNQLLSHAGINLTNEFEILQCCLDLFHTIITLKLNTNYFHIQYSCLNKNVNCLNEINLNFDDKKIFDYKTIEFIDLQVQLRYFFSHILSFNRYRNKTNFNLKEYKILLIKINILCANISKKLKGDVEAIVSDFQNKNQKFIKKTKVVNESFEFYHRICKSFMLNLFNLENFLKTYILSNIKEKISTLKKSTHLQTTVNIKNDLNILTGFYEDATIILEEFYNFFVHKDIHIKEISQGTLSSPEEKEEPKVVNLLKIDVTLESPGKRSPKTFKNKKKSLNQPKKITPSTTINNESVLEEYQEASYIEGLEGHIKRRSLLKWMKDHDWKIFPGEGKGSHSKALGPNGTKTIIPHHDSISPGTLKSIKESIKDDLTKKK